MNTTTRKRNRPPRLPNGTRVHVRSDHFVEECDAVIRKAESDHGWTHEGERHGWWLYRIEVTAGQTPKDAQHKDGTLWVWDFEVTPIT